MSEELSERGTVSVDNLRLMPANSECSWTAGRDCEVQDDSEDSDLDISLGGPTRRDRCEEPTKLKAGNQVSVGQVETLRRRRSCRLNSQSNVRLDGFLIKADLNVDAGLQAQTHHVDASWGLLKAQLEAESDSKTAAAVRQ
eukprot:1813318-Rhodomonas_salina.2